METSRETEYLVIVPIESMHVGDVYPKGELLPLHCTIMPWFTLGTHLDYNKLDGILTKLSQEVKGGVIELVSKYKDFFGPENDVEVHVLEKNDTVTHLHNQLLTLLHEAHVTPISPQWLGKGYRPHITDVSSQMQTGDSVKVHSLCILEHAGDRVKRVLKEYTFGSN